MRTGYAYQPSAQCTYRRRRAAYPQGATYCTYGARVPASGVPELRRTLFITPSHLSALHTRHGTRSETSLVITPSVRWLSPQVLPARAARTLPQLSPLKLTRAPRGPRTTVRTGCACPPPTQCTRSVRTGGAGRLARRAPRTIRILYVRTGYAYQTRARYVRTVARQACSSAG